MKLFSESFLLIRRERKKPDHPWIEWSGICCFDVLLRFSYHSPVKRGLDFDKCLRYNTNKETR